MKQFTAGDKCVSVYSGESGDLPVVYLNTFGNEGEAVYQELKQEKGPNFHFVTISGLQWDHDMSPWKIPPIAKGDTPCTGGAGQYMEILRNEIVPKAESLILGKPLWRGIAGYSLAGLFAVYSLYQTSLFSRAASISGSLWFPDFQKYVSSHNWKSVPDRVYFSLGDKEHRTKNPFLKGVRERTEEICAFYTGKGIDTVLQFNPGNHFQNEGHRIARGIRWILR